MRVRFEERRERQLAGGSPRNSPRASYTFPARDTTKLREVIHWNSKLLTAKCAGSERRSSAEPFNNPQTT
jgi:hypothetical protein